MRIDGQIGHSPLVGAVLFSVVHAFGDGILVAAGECCEDQTAGIGLPGRYLHVGDPLIDLADGGHVREVQLRIHAVGVHVHGQSDRIHVACALAVAEQTAFHTLCSCQQCQFRIGNAGTAVVVRMGGQNDGIPAMEAVTAILDLVGINVRETHFHGHRQVDDHGSVGGGFHDIDDGVADLQGVFRFSAGEGFRGILEEEVALIFLRELFDKLCAFHGDLLDFLFGFSEHLFALGNGGGVVEMDHGTGRTFHSFECPADDVIAALGEDLYGHVFGDEVLFDQCTQELILCFAGCGEPDFDFLESDSDQELEKLYFFLQAHGYDQGLVAIPQIHGTPGRCLFNVVFPDPAVFVFRCRVISRCVFRSVHHNSFLLLDMSVVVSGDPVSRGPGSGCGVGVKKTSLKNHSETSTFIPAVPLFLSV